MFQDPSNLGKIPPVAAFPVDLLDHTKSKAHLTRNSVRNHRIEPRKVDNIFQFYHFYGEKYWFCLFIIASLTKNMFNNRFTNKKHFKKTHIASLTKNTNILVVIVGILSIS